MFGDDVVPCEIAGVTSGSATLGHRFHHPGVITIGSAGDYRVFTYDGSGSTELFFTLPLEYGADWYEQLTTVGLKMYKDGSNTTTVKVYKLAGLNAAGTPALTLLDSATSNSSGLQVITVGGLTTQASDDQMILVAVTGGDVDDKAYGVRFATVGTEV